MAKRRTKQQIKRQQKRAAKEAAMARGENAKGRKSTYAKKNRAKEIAQGYSTRPTSPFYLPPSQREAA